MRLQEAAYVGQPYMDYMDSLSLAVRIALLVVHMDLLGMSPNTGLLEIVCISDATRWTKIPSLNPHPEAGNKKLTYNSQPYKPYRQHQPSSPRETARHKPPTPPDSQHGRRQQSQPELNIDLVAEFISPKKCTLSVL